MKTSNRKQVSGSMSALVKARSKSKRHTSLLWLAIFNPKYSKIFHLITFVWMFFSILPRPVIGEVDENVNANANVKVPQKNLALSSTMGRNNPFYDTNANNAPNYPQFGSNTCLPDHSVKKRNVEGVNGKERKNDKLAREGDEDYYFGMEMTKEEIEGPSECNSCARDKLRMKSLETIKDSILSKLGMSHPPNVTEKPKPKIADNLLMMLLKKRHTHRGSNGLFWVVQDNELEEIRGMQGDAPYVVQEFGNRSRGFIDKRNVFHGSNVSELNRFISEANDFQEGEILMEEEDDFHVRTERIVTFAQSHPRIRHLPYIQYFEFNERLRSSRVKRAILWVYIRGRDTTSGIGNRITISIYKILDAGKPGSSGARESPVIASIRADSTQSIPKGTGAWITMEYVQIKNLVSEWFKNPQNNLGIVINAVDESGTNLAVTSHNGNDTTFVPFLEVYVTDNRKHRTKRTVGLNCKDSSKETRCCRYPLTVDFVEFGWDWIIAPKRYEAFYCAGECPFAFLTQHPHTHVFQLTNTRGGGPCCAPRKLSELEMLYFDQNMNIIFGRIPAMKVDRCGCT